MFTGIITHTGIISAHTGSGITIRAGAEFVRALKRGTSVSVDGVCLTVVSKRGDTFSAHLMQETRRRSTLRSPRDGASVNLELPATPVSLLSGHIVQGHVDATAKLTNISRSGDSRILEFSVPRTLSRYIVEKGSIALNGIALTLVNTGSGRFAVGIIPHTWENTSLCRLGVGQAVNVEVDILAKYIERSRRQV